MKILFIADIHIKLGQKNVPKKWAIDRYNMLWAEVAQEARVKCCYSIVFGGDIFDAIPSTEEIGVFFSMLSALCEFDLVMYPGNHEAKGKTTSWLSHFKEAVRPFNCVIIDEWTPAFFPGIDILPYTDLKSKKWHGRKNTMLMTHVRGEIPPHVQPEVDLSLFNGWDIVFAGDLHAHSNSQLNIVYPGSPITTSFHRGVSKGENGCLIIDTDLKEYEYIDLGMPQLIRLTVEDPALMVETEYHRTIYELVGDLQSLTVTVDKGLLDKKISKRSKEATLSLANKTIEEELYEYLTKVEKIETPQDIMEEVNDSIKRG
jgi:DNA repair exonuclease SbcCD nuclease subunit